ncbi:MAG: LysR substrate-binding domain-containing protein [Paracoccaceae bacterium]
MQHPPSLNALRVFLAAARLGSLKLAASELSVTPGAVSHQVRQLERALGTPLFQRRNNGIELTPAGAALAEEAAAGLAILHGALENVARDAHELTVSVSMTLATRWLIPRLESFRARNPHARIRLETVNGTGLPDRTAADIAIAYVRRDDLPDGADILLKDRCRPHLSPSAVRPSWRTIPALQSATGNWDWDLWLRSTGQEGIMLQYAASFDVDDAALRAAVAGMGMVLCPDFMVADDVAAGRLVPLDGAPAETLGYYLIQRGHRETGLSERFVRWLRAQV